MTGDRGLLVNVGYRLLGSVAEAEDAVQEAYARWYAMADADREAVASPTGWLVTAVSRICLDVLRSARVRRERYVGEWLPEPVPGPPPWGAAADPAEQAALDDSLRMALLVVLESMTPAERVAFVLHDVFRYPFSEIGRVLGRTPQACRQLAASARRRVRDGAAYRPSAHGHARTVAAFKSAWEDGDVAGLVRLLDPDAVAVTDGGGLVSAPLEPVVGAEAIAGLLLTVLRRLPGLTVHHTVVNGRAGLVTRLADRTLAVLSVDVADGRVRRIWTMRNPEKLTAWT